jgi:hypothetical protein
MIDADKNLKESNQDVKASVIAADDRAKLQAIAHWKSFNNESDTAIAGMEKEVTMLEVKMTKADNAAKSKSKTELDNAKKKSQDLKKKL